MIFFSGDYKAITQSVLKQHKLRMHEGTIPDKVLPRHVCDMCGKSFVSLKFNPSSLKQFEVLLRIKYFFLFRK